MSRKPLRAALYLRISKDDARTGLAVDRQRSECMAVIERDGLELVGEYVDNGVSAYARNVKRPAFDRMTADYRRGLFDVVVCWDMDRFSRQPAQLEGWIELGESRGLRIVTPTETTDLGTDNGRMFARMKATIARAEVERKSARQRAQVKQAKEAGTFRGRVGFNDAEVIRGIFADLLAGQGPYQIAKRLNAEGSQTVAGNSWSGQAVRRVGLTPRHRGVIVSAEDFDSVGAILRRGVRVGAKHEGAYSGTARCVCGASMTSSGPKYTCAFATNHPGAEGHVTVSRKLFEARIRREVIAELMLPGNSGPDDGSAAEIARIDAKLAALAGRKAERLADVRDQSLGLAMADIRPELADIAAEVADLDSRRAELVTQSASVAMLDGLRASIVDPDTHRADIDSAAQVADVLGERFDALDGERRRELIRAMLDVRIIAGRGAERIKVWHRAESAQSLNEPSESV